MVLQKEYLPGVVLEALGILQTVDHVLYSSVSVEIEFFACKVLQGRK